MESINLTVECSNIEMKMRSDYEQVCQVVDSSNSKITDLKKDCIEKVLSIQHANNAREAERHEVEKKLKEDMTKFIEEKAAEAQTQLDEINSKWKNILSYNDSLDIYNACENQRNQYMQVIQCKDKIIATLKEELEKANLKFVDDLKIQRADINSMSDRINKQVEIMRSAYRQHLALIEETADEERKLFLYRKQNDWTRLNAVLAEREKEVFNDTFKAVEEYEKDISDMTSQHREKFRATKKNLELELQSLHIKFEETKIACLLNEKKLEYNYLVVSKRHEELGKIKAKQRRRINRLRDVLMEIENKKLQSRQLHMMEIKKLQNAISALKLNKQNLSDKMRKIELVNDTTFKKIWKLNEKRAKIFLQKILSADKQLHEQELCVKWEPPNLTSMKIMELPSVQFALRHLPNFRRISEVLETRDHETKSNEVASLFESLFDVNLMKFILLNIKESIKFTICDKMDSLMENLMEEKQTLVGFDNILKILNINTDVEMDLLKKQFIPFIECVTCEEEKRKQEMFPTISKYRKSLSENKRTGSGNRLFRRPVHFRRPFSARTTTVVNQKENFSIVNICRNPEHVWFIKQLTVIQILSDFMKEKKLREKKEKEMEPLQRIPLSRILSPKDMELYWYAFRSTFIQERKGFWNVTHSCLSNYYSVLQDQIMRRTRVESIEKQNSELKRILNNVSENVDIEDAR